MSWCKAFAAVTVAAMLAACGFTPIHGGTRGPAVRAELASVRIDPIEERVGQMLRNHLLDSMNPSGAPARPLYRLIVLLSEGKEELAVQRSEFATRANLRLNATYRLVRVSDGAQVYIGASNLIASYNILSNDYATLAAEGDARARASRELSDDITQRVAAFFRQQAEARPQERPLAPP
jgi:LPS-assembly lipoprotein